MRQRTFDQSKHTVVIGSKADLTLLVINDLRILLIPALNLRREPSSVLGTAQQAKGLAHAPSFDAASYAKRCPIRPRFVVMLTHRNHLEAEPQELFEVLV